MDLGEFSISATYSDKTKWSSGWINLDSCNEKNALDKLLQLIAKNYQFLFVWFLKNGTVLVHGVGDAATTWRTYNNPDYRRDFWPRGVKHFEIHEFNPRHCWVENAKAQLKQAF